MRLYIDCKTNSDRPYINYAVFKDNEGNEYTIDREWTCYDVEDDELSMEWKDIYLWDAEEDEDCRKEIDENWFKDKTFVRLEIEEDAGLDYYCDPYAVETVS